jgi:spore coat protein A, manganese oxidase
MDRRKFIKILGAAGAASALPFKFNPLKGFSQNRAWAFQQSPALKKFVQPLPGLGAGVPGTSIQMATSVTDPVFANTNYYQIGINEFRQVLHPQLAALNPNGTKLWGYTDIGPNKMGQQTHLGALIAIKRGTAARLRFTNNLPNNHPLPVDPTVDDDPTTATVHNKTAVHLHGGLIPWISDGGPFDWWTPGGTNYANGASFLNGPGGVLDNITTQPMVQGQADYYYPNDQSYRLMWYHDHAHDITRLNAYAGVATGYYLYDDVMLGMEANGMLPRSLLTDPGRNRLIPLIFQDKIFNGASGNTEPGGTGGPGDLWYPSVYDPGRWTVGTNPAGPTNTLPVPSCVPEAFMDTMLVNGMVYPYVEVEQRKYRFLMLNACNARFLRLRLFYAQGAGFPNNAEPDLAKAGPAFVQFANEGGFLPAPVTLTGSSVPTTLLLSPAQRAECLVDFTNVPAGSFLILYSDAPAPFPVGDPFNDYYVGAQNPSGVITQPGFGPNTRTILQIRVKARVGAADASRPLVLPPIDPKPLLPVPPGTFVRNLSLNEGFDSYGRLVQLIGNDVFNPNTATFGYPYTDSNLSSPTRETMADGKTEVWRIANLTGDTHPMHIHLVNWQIISRQPFDPAAYPVLNYLGPARGPDPNERGWNETVRMNPGEVITVIAKFDLPKNVPFTVPPSPRTGGNEYVWHCHILEHEEHDMMHALVVT